MNHSQDQLRAMKMFEVIQGQEALHQNKQVITKNLKSASLANQIGEDLARKYSQVKKKNRECSLYSIISEDRELPAFDQTFASAPLKKSTKQKLVDLARYFLSKSPRSIHLEYRQRNYIYPAKDQNKMPWSTMQIQSADLAFKHLNIQSSNRQQQDYYVQGSYLRDRGANESHVTMYNRKILLYENLVKENPFVAVKGVTQIKVHDKTIGTREIQSDFKSHELVNLETLQANSDSGNLIIYSGEEYRFCLNDFPDILDFYRREKDPADIEKVFKCSLMIFQLTSLDNTKGFKKRLSDLPQLMTENQQQKQVLIDVTFTEPMINTRIRDMMKLLDPNTPQAEGDSQTTDEKILELQASIQGGEKSTNQTYVELRGYCTEHEVGIYSRLMYEFSKKFSTLGIVLLKPSLTTIVPTAHEKAKK